MVKHIDKMQRRGTKSWIMAKHNVTCYAPNTPDEAESKEGKDPPNEDKNPILSAITRKHKISNSSPARKRPKGKAAVSQEILQK